MPSYIWEMAQDFSLQAFDGQEGITYSALKWHNWHFLPAPSVLLMCSTHHLEYVLAAFFENLLNFLKYLIFVMPLNPTPKRAHLPSKCDCLRIFLVLIIFLSFLKWEEVPFAETRVFFEEFPVAASERCDRDFQWDPLAKSASETGGSQNQSVSKGPVWRDLADSQVSCFKSQEDSK